MISIPFVALAMLIAFGAGILAAVALSGTDDGQDAAAWRQVWAELTAKGWCAITPQLVVALVPNSPGAGLDSTD
jgi:hypothetical protein